MTDNEKIAIEREIELLRKELSTTIPEEMKSAAALGDLKENSEFSSAVMRQHFINIRLKQLMEELKLYNSVNLQSIPKDRVGLGSIIKTKCLKTNKIVKFKIVVGRISDKENPKYQEVTLKSPIGSAFNDHKVNDVVTVYHPTGKSTYKILDITTIHYL